MPLAEVRLTCGRYVLFVAGLAVAMEGDQCRQDLPDDVAEPIPQDELERATIGGQPCNDMPLSVVRTFRGELWRLQSLEWAATQINAAAAPTTA